MKKDTTGYEPINFKVNVAGFRWFMERIHWYVLASALVFGITASLARVTPLFIILASLTSIPLVVGLVEGISRGRYLYHFLGIVFWATAAGFVGRITGLRGDFEKVEAMMLSFLPLTLLLWAGRRWVMQYCRLQEETVMPETKESSQHGAG